MSTSSTQLSARNLLVICGSSGSGKSTLEKNLIEAFPDKFHKWQQLSTRKMREGERFGDPYVFVQGATFEHMQDKLVGRLGVVEGTLFKDRYGSIPDYVDGKVSTVILAEEAIYDLKQQIAAGAIPVDQVFILGLDVKYEELDQKDLREGRDAEFLAREKSVLNHANMVYRMSNGKYYNPRLLVDILKDQGMLN